MSRSIFGLRMYGGVVREYKGLCLYMCFVRCMRYHKDKVGEKDVQRLGIVQMEFSSDREGILRGLNIHFPSI